MILTDKLCELRRTPLTGNYLVWGICHHLPECLFPDLQARKSQKKCGSLKGNFHWTKQKRPGTPQHTLLITTAASFRTWRGSLETRRMGPDLKTFIISKKLDHANYFLSPLLRFKKTDNGIGKQNELSCCWILDLILIILFKLFCFHSTYLK